MNKPGKAYDLPLRQRVLKEYFSDGDLSLRDVSRIYTVAPSWIAKLASQYNEEEGWTSLEPFKQGWVDQPRKIGEEMFECLAMWCRSRPKTTLREYQCLLLCWFELEVSTSTICKAFLRNTWVIRVTQYVHRNKFTPENLKCYRDYCGWITEQDAGRVKFFDESHFDERVFRSKRARTQKGVRVEEEQGAKDSRAYSLCLLTLLDQDPPFYFDVIDGSCDGSKYVDFGAKASKLMLSERVTL